MRTQNDTIREGGKSCLEFYLKVSQLLENHFSKSQIIDVNMEHVLAVSVNPII